MPGWFSPGRSEMLLKNPFPAISHVSPLSFPVLLAIDGWKAVLLLGDYFTLWESPLLYGNLYHYLGVYSPLFEQGSLETENGAFFFNMSLVEKKLNTKRGIFRWI